MDSDGAADPNVTVDAFTSADLDACLAVFDLNVPEFFHDGERPEFRTFLQDLPGPYLVLRDTRGDVVACGGWAMGENGVADLCWGMVRRDLHGRGWGRRLTQARLNGIDATPGVRTVELRTSQHTDGLYEGFGFRTVEIRPDGFGPGLDCLVMRRAPKTTDSDPPEDVHRDAGESR